MNAKLKKVIANATDPQWLFDQTFKTRESMMPPVWLCLTLAGLIIGLPLAQ